MSEHSFPDALAQLLTDARLRAQFASDAAAVIRTLGVTAGDAATLSAIPIAMLEHQAHTLLHKRFEAVRKHIPATLRALNEHAWERFAEYAIAEWPQGHRRHLSDASGFCRWLRSRGMFFDQGELNALRFALSPWPLSTYFIWRANARGVRRLTLQLFYRTSRCSGEWRFYIGV